MNKDTPIKLFESKKIRSVRNEEDKWYYSIIDIVEVLIGTDRPRKFRSDLKYKLKKEGGELSEKIGQLKAKGEDGKIRISDVADTERDFRFIQSNPSVKAEPFKLWLAKAGLERIDKIEDLEMGSFQSHALISFSHSHALSINTLALTI